MWIGFSYTVQILVIVVLTLVFVFALIFMQTLQSSGLISTSLWWQRQRVIVCVLGVMGLRARGLQLSGLRAKIVHIFIFLAPDL